MPTFVALLRGINVSGRNRLPMAELRSLCADLGWRDVRTYVQSGNVVFGANGAPWSLETELELALERQLGLSVPVLVRADTEWNGYVRGNPFPEESEREPNLVMLALSRAAPAPGSVAGLRERATGEERIERVGDALWIHYGEGAGRSRIAPGSLDRLVGSPVTTRNWRTVLELDALVQGAGSGAEPSR